MYFTIEELTKTNQNIDNTPTEGAKKNLERLIENVLDRLRILYGKPIKVNSGYRSIAVNKAVRGSSTSQHTKGYAADITGGNVDENMKLFHIIKDSLEFDQLINEHNFSWIHVSYVEGKNRKQVLEASKNKLGKTIYNNCNGII